MATGTSLVLHLVYEAMYADHVRTLKENEIEALEQRIEQLEKSMRSVMAAQTRFCAPMLTRTSLLGGVRSVHTQKVERFRSDKASRKSEDAVVQVATIQTDQAIKDSHSKSSPIAKSSPSTTSRFI
ncbi:hypothetical protein BDF19DRAFT_463278 [Syncephalis fuscata]|nr:hypothetical protein BDF19DRAFT_463278 [Syncephalis fuscata]